MLTLIHNAGYPLTSAHPLSYIQKSLHSNTLPVVVATGTGPPTPGATPVGTGDGSQALQPASAMMLHTGEGPPLI